VTDENQKPFISPVGGIGQGILPQVGQPQIKKCPPHNWIEKGDYFICIDCGKNVLKDERKLIPYPVPPFPFEPRPWRPRHPYPHWHPRWGDPHLPYKIQKTTYWT